MLCIVPSAASEKSKGSIVGSYCSGTRFGSAYTTTRFGVLDNNRFQ